uniref:BRMS1 like transcriptional repressor b n=1 Tax=Takifugu rubripes TaxID=31033 RepID=A0A674PN82_TAKRU
MYSCSPFTLTLSQHQFDTDMPVHRDQEKKESTAVDMEVEEQEHEASSTEEEDFDTTSISEDGESSGEEPLHRTAFPFKVCLYYILEMDEEDCERRRMECLDEMSNLEKQFTDLKEQLYRERLSQVNSKLAEVEAGRAAEYLEPLAVLLENMQVRTKVAGIYRELCLESVKHKYDCETQAACQHWESEKLLLFDTVQNELEEKIRRLEEDRHSIDITSGNRGHHAIFVTSAQHIVVTYQVPEPNDPAHWTAIRKAVATLGPHRGKADYDSSAFPFRTDRNRPILNC